MDAVEHLVGRVVSPDNPDEDHGPPGEGDELPGPAGVPRPVAHHLPVPLVDADLDVVTVASVIAVPEQHPHGVQAVGLAKLHHDGPGAEPELHDPLVVHGPAEAT